MPREARKRILSFSETRTKVLLQDSMDSTQDTATVPAMSKMETLAVTDTQKPGGAWLAAGRARTSIMEMQMYCPECPVTSVANRSKTQNLQTLLLSAERLV